MRRNPNWLDTYSRSVSNIKLLIGQQKDALAVPTAQVDAWAAVHRGDLDDTATEIDRLLADAALGHMMLHRRRASALRVIDEFFASAGSRFKPYLGDLAPAGFLDSAGETAAAKVAAATAERVCSSTAPLLFERATMAETEGRAQDAAADLERLLDAYPGFVAAALAAGRLAFAKGDPVRAIEVLTYVQRELVEMREGSGLLADVLRAIGMPDVASRYDVAAVTGLGYMDSRGNDFAPVDVSGSVVSHSRILPAFYVDQLPSGNSVYNDRGIYYVTNSAVSKLLFSLLRSHDASKDRTRQRCARSSKWPMPDALRALCVRLKPVGYKMAPVGAVATGLMPRILEAGRQLLSLHRAVDRLLRRALPQLAAWGLLKIPERDRHSPIVQARLRSGIIAIFGSRLAALSARAATKGGNGAGGEPLPNYDESSLETQLQRLCESGTLPPMAVQALARLMSRLHSDHNAILRL
jgi:Tetratricopeptide repeat